MSVEEAEPTETKPRWGIPHHWSWVTIANVAEVITGNTPPTKEADNYGPGIPFVKPPELNDRGIRSAADSLTTKGIKLSRVLPSGAVLVSCIGGLGKTGLARTAIAFNQQINGVVFDKRVVPEFGFYYSQTLKPWLYGVASATTLPIVNKGKFKRAPFPLAPINEQKAIVAEIEKQFSRLDEAVASLKRTKANLKRYKAAVLKAAVEGKLTQDWRKQHPNVEPASKLLEHILGERRVKWRGKRRYKEPAGPDNANLPSLPKGWAWATVEQLGSGLPGSIQSGPFGSQLLHSEFVKEGVLAIGIDNILDGKFSLGSQHRITPKNFEVLRKFEARPRDVVITVMATVGRVCVLPQNLERAIITKHCYRITPAGEAVDSDYLAIALRAESSTRQHIFGNVRGQTRPGINGPILKAAPMALPPPREQQQIVAEVERRLSVIAELEATIEANLTRAERLRQSILNQAFTGKLTCVNANREGRQSADIEKAKA